VCGCVRRGLKPQLCSREALLLLTYFVAVLVLCRAARISAL
jgi:hypothetical protein